MVTYQVGKGYVNINAQFCQEYHQSSIPLDCVRKVHRFLEGTVEQIKNLKKKCYSFRNYFLDVSSYKNKNHRRD